MDPVTSFDNILTLAGYGKFVPVVLAGVGFFSVLSTFYPPTWKGANTVHKLALLVANAKPLVPPTTSATNGNTSNA